MRQTKTTLAIGSAGNVRTAAWLVDPEEVALGLPTFHREVPLVVRDASFDADGNLLYRPKVGRQFVSEDRRRSTDATNHLAATPETQSGSSVRTTQPVVRTFDGGALRAARSNAA